MPNKIKQRLRHDTFLPSPLAVATSPLYIIRNGLFQSILKIAPGIGGDVLDFGCGCKPYESLFINARNYVGVDIQVSGHSHKDSKVDFFYDGKKLPFPDDHFDAVVSFEVFEHIFNVEEVLAEIRRVLKPGGQILITIPFAWDEHETPYDFARYTSFGIKHLLERNKVEVVQIHKTTTYFLAVCQMLIAYLRQYVFPKNRLLIRLFQLILIFPLNILAIVFNSLLPKRYEYFCNCVVLGKNIKSR